MKKQFTSNNKTFYMKKSPGDTFDNNDFFLLKIKKLLDKHHSLKSQNKFNLMIVASRKIANAVIRNKIKRRIRMLFSELNISSKCSIDYVYVIILSIGIDSVIFSDLSLSLQKSIHKINARLKYYESKNRSCQSSIPHTEISEKIIMPES